MFVWPQTAGGPPSESNPVGGAFLTKLGLSYFSIRALQTAGGGGHATIPVSLCWGSPPPRLWPSLYHTPPPGLRFLTAPIRDYRSASLSARFSRLQDAGQRARREAPLTLLTPLTPETEQGLWSHDWNESSNRSSKLLGHYEGQTGRSVAPSACSLQRVKTCST